MDFFIFLTQKILATGAYLVIMGILPAFTIGLFWLFDFEYLAELAREKYNHSKYMKKVVADGGKPWKYNSDIKLKDYLPFKLPIGIFMMLVMAIVSVGAIGGFMGTPMYRDLSGKTFQTYEEYRAKDAVQNPVRTDVRVDLHRIRLDAWTPPKHFYVDFTDLTSNQSFERVYVSKHCNSASQLSRGEEYNVQVQVYTLSSQPGKEFREYKNLYGVFCS